MDLKQLEYIIAIADYGNITKAAEALFITQSGLNQQLIRLEKELNIQLFERNKRHLHLTQAGEIYVNHAREMIKLKHNAYSMIQDLGDCPLSTAWICFSMSPPRSISGIPGSRSIWRSTRSATSTRCSPRDFWT